MSWGYLDAQSTPSSKPGLKGLGLDSLAFPHGAADHAHPRSVVRPSLDYAREEARCAVRAVRRWAREDLQEASDPTTPAGLLGSHPARGDDPKGPATERGERGSEHGGHPATSACSTRAARRPGGPAAGGDPRR